MRATRGAYLEHGDDAAERAGTGASSTHEPRDGAPTMQTARQEAHREAHTVSGTGRGVQRQARQTGGWHGEGEAHGAYME